MKLLEYFSDIIKANNSKKRKTSCFYTVQGLISSSTFQDGKNHIYFNQKRLQQIADWNQENELVIFDSTCASWDNVYHIQGIDFKGSVDIGVGGSLYLEGCSFAKKVKLEANGEFCLLKVDGKNKGTFADDTEVIFEGSYTALANYNINASKMTWNFGSNCIELSHITGLDASGLTMINDQGYQFVLKDCKLSGFMGCLNTNNLILKGTFPDSDIEFFPFPRFLLQASHVSIIDVDSAGISFPGYVPNLNIFNVGQLFFESGINVGNLSLEKVKTATILRSFVVSSQRLSLRKTYMQGGSIKISDDLQMDPASALNANLQWGDEKFTQGIKSNEVQPIRLRRSRNLIFSALKQVAKVADDHVRYDQAELASQKLQQQYDYDQEQSFDTIMSKPLDDKKPVGKILRQQPPK